ncbi:SUMF1/EgtB/PvdO family nonheme iron enzyme [Ideonella sp. 4Y16]|uniref:SUMF1/EgtB/PvdO family nonheme iron enzyme n=1 Tax=Ideonella alba TaxID=2824118 RepID=UPI001B38B7BB|nr:SUMF1/EgtB/PvdO family nonheme iron enzyme [Ideonella alba]MBQ0942228.1 SUMF1/EgtB/PvdO family nonheme iron enzyme [Ideonella alba]
MRPEDIQDFIARLPGFSAEGWQHLLLAREGALPPQLLPFVADLPAHTTDAAALLDAHLPIVAELPPLTDAQGRPRLWVERPLHQVQRVVHALLAGHDLHTNTPPQVLGIGPDTAPLSIVTQQHLAQAMGIAARWLQAAVRSGPAADPQAANPAARTPWHSWLPPQAGPACTLPVVLVNTALRQGVQAELSLRLVPEPGARLCLVPAPASSLLLRVDTEWDDTLAQLRQALLADLRDNGAWPLQDTAIAWDLYRRDGQPLLTLEGPSAGASLALGALWLLRAAAPPSWQHDLMALEPRHLRRCAFTAALGPGWQMLPVGGLGEKSEALLPLAHAIAAQAAHDGAEAPLALGVSHLQDVPVGAGQAAPGRVAIQPYYSVLEAAQVLASQADRLSPEQQQLWDLLVAPGDAPLSPSPGLLRQVAQQPALSLRQYLLRCWAQCAQAMHPSLPQRFVPLDLVPLKEKDRKYQSLHELLLERDSTMKENGYLLRGKPGAGKSTLLRHHLQRAARRLLQWHAGSFVPTADDAGQPPPHELPVYLALNKLLPQESPDTWLREQLSHQLPPELLQLLAGQGSWARERGLKARVLLDGLNELRVAHAGQRPARARQVVGAMQALLRGPAGLPLLLSIRPQHADALGEFKVLKVEVQDWTDSHIKAYLGQWFPGEVEARFKALAAVKGALSLCGRPQQLAAQCELMDSGLKALPGDRAALFNAWLWQRLRRARGRESGHEEAREADNALDDSALGVGPADDVLLTSEDCAAIEDDERWQQQGPPSVTTLKGQLVRSLAGQALAQWAADAGPAAAGTDRTAGEQPFDSVAPWLHRSTDAALTHPEEALRKRFARAARALGVVQVDDACSTWAFDHQAWGEFLASCALLATNPPASAGLLRRLWLPALPHDSDEAEISALAQDGSQAWQAVPQAVWAGLLKDGLPVPWEDLLNDCYNPPPRDAREMELASRQVVSDFPEFFGDGTWRDITKDGQRWCRANLGLWGDTFGVSAALNLGQAEDWRNPRKAGAAGWQFLVLQRLRPVFRDKFWKTLRDLLGDEAVEALQGQQGRLEEPPAAEGAEVLGLALLGLPLPRLRAWLQALLAVDGPAAPRAGAPDEPTGQPTGPLWPALAGVLPALQARLEPEGAWGEHAAAGAKPRPPDPALQHLRRVLLLHSLDAGAASLAGVRASGLLDLLDAPPAVALPAELQAAWQRWRAAAFQGAGQRLRLRLQAGLALGELGDNIRYQFIRPTRPNASPGLRPHPLLWAQVGPSERNQEQRFWIGGGDEDDEQPAWQAPLPGFLACRLPLTVGEWRWFRRSPQGQRWEWTMADDADFNNPLQPVTGISWRALCAYAEWADAQWDEAPGPDGQPASRPHLALPTEVQWEAAARGPLRGEPAAAHDTPPPATLFNHANTRWARPSPVGCFSRGFTALGLADTQGNVCEFCANALTDEQLARGWHEEADQVAANQPAEDGDRGDRALRGGAFTDAAARCRASYRLLNRPGLHYGNFGVRLVRVWPPP